jgi:starch phosphorylase
VLTIGFARRTATYKRIGLLTHDPGRTLALLAGPQPVQFVLASKAHPSDEEGKRVVQEMFRVKDAPHVAEDVVYLFRVRNPCPQSTSHSWSVRGC